ncbi:MAG: hypothetical protein ABII82_03165 [Verrucomicrobiota bacterium]
MSYSDEPVLVRPARRPLGLWIAIAGTLVVLAAMVYVPWQNHRLHELAHDAERGERGGTVHTVNIAGVEHRLSLGWVRGPVFAIGCTPPPPTGSTLVIKGRFGTDTLAWNAEQNAFGPGQSPVDPADHYKLKLTLLDATGTHLWTDTLWAYGVVSGHQH